MLAHPVERITYRFVDLASVYDRHRILGLGYFDELADGRVHHGHLHRLFGRDAERIAGGF